MAFDSWKDRGNRRLGVGKWILVILLILAVVISYCASASYDDTLFILILFGWIGVFTLLILRKVIDLVWVSLILVIPLGIHNFLIVQQPNYIRLIHGFVITAEDIPLVILLAYILFEALVKRERRLHFPLHVLLPMLVLFALLVLSSLKVPSKFLAFCSLYGVVRVWLFFFVVNNFIKTRKDIVLFVLALFCCLFYETVFEAIQFVKGAALNIPFLRGAETTIYKTVIQGETKFERVGGTLGGANELAMFLNMIVLLAFSVFMSRTKMLWLRLIALAAVIVGVLGVVFTYSRGGWISLALPAILLALLLLRYHLKSFLKASVVMTFLLVIAASAALSIPNIRERLFAEDRGSIERRGEMIGVAYRMIEKHPLRGVGLGEYLHYEQSYDRSVKGFQKTDKIQSCHSFLFLMAAENGIPTVVVYLVLFFSVCVYVLKFLRRKVMDAEPLLAFIGIGLVFGLLAQFLQANVIIYKPFLANFQWLFMGAVIAVNRMIDMRMSRPEEEDLFIVV